jgi:hypothetical protein
VGGEKAILVILSVPTGRRCPFLTFWLNRWTPLSITQPLYIAGVLILGVYCPPVKWQDLLSYLEEVAGVLAISVMLDWPLAYTVQIVYVSLPTTSSCSADRDHPGLGCLRDKA